MGATIIIPPGQTVQTQNLHNLTLAGNTSGVLAQVSSGTLTLVGGNNITLSQAGNAVTISGPSPLLQAQISGNTSNTSNPVTGSLVLAGGNNITLSQVSAAGAATITISGADIPPQATTVTPVGTANSVGTATRYAAEDHRHAGVGSMGVSNLGNTAGNTGTTLGKVVFVGGNNITLSQDTAAGGNATITISAPSAAAAQTGVSAISAGTTLATSGTVSFADGNGVSFGVDGQTLTASVAAIPAIATTVKSVGSANSVGTVTRYAAEDHVHAGIIQAQITGNTSNTSNVVQGSLYLAGGNNITLSQVTGAGAATITISAANETQTVPPIATTVAVVGSANSVGTVTRFAAEDHVHRGVAQFQISGNTSNTSNLVFGSLVLAGGNNITLSQASAAGGATVTISAANETKTVPPIATAVSSVGSANSVGTVTRFAAEDHVHAGLIQAQITGNTSNTSNVVQGSLYLAGGNNITLSQATGAGAATITISAPNAAAGFTISTYDYYAAQISGNATHTTISMHTGSSGSMHLAPFIVPCHVAAEFLGVVGTANISTAGTSSYVQTATFAYGLYTRQLGASSTALSLAGSSMWSYLVTYSNSSITLIHPTTTNAGGGYGYGTTNSSGVNVTSGYTGTRMFLLGLGSTLTPGQYWFGFHHRASFAGDLTTRGLSLNMSGGLFNFHAIAAGFLAASSDFQSGTKMALQIGGAMYLGNGSYSQAGMTNVSDSVEISAITSGTFRPFFHIASRV